MSSLQNFTVALADLKRVGQGLRRPESVLADKDGSLWISDSEGGVVCLKPDGSQTHLPGLPGESNGLAMDSQGNFYIANIGGGNLYKLYRDGRTEVILSEIDGQPLGSVNFVFIDSQDRLWVSVLTRSLPWFPAINTGVKDGYIILIDQKGPRIVADGIYFANEVRMDAEEKYLYAAETLGRHMLRFAVGADGSLGQAEVFGPADLGEGAAIDGFTFDAEGNLWVTTVLRNGLVVISADGSQAHTIFEDPNEAALTHAFEKISQSSLSPEEMFACVGPQVQFPTSVVFAGPDLKTVYMGSLAMPHLLSFESPVAGLPMRHWR